METVIRKCEKHGDVKHAITYGQYDREFYSCMLCELEK